ncbi:MAG TPA: transcriptional regulator [Elusimicrobia bacterium]|nr:transcriptional regulator [Elusimicrobiota bacterium]
MRSVKSDKELARLHHLPGVFKTKDVLGKLKIHPRKFYAMVGAGLIEKISRGTYRLAAGPALTNPDMVTVAVRVPKGVICLLSALAYHGITTQIPREVYVALPQGAERPKVAYPPARFFHFSKQALSSGIETREIDGVPVKIYNPEKTLADCFKFRNTIGLDTAMEALKMYLRLKNRDINKLVEYAGICRVRNVMRPYLESMV